MFFFFFGFKLAESYPKNKNEKIRRLTRPRAPDFRRARIFSPKNLPKKLAKTGNGLTSGVGWLLGWARGVAPGVNWLLCVSLCIRPVRVWIAIFKKMLGSRAQPISVEQHFICFSGRGMRKIV